LIKLKRGVPGVVALLLQYWSPPPGLKKNLVSVAILEDKGYDVVFGKGKAFLRHIAMGQTKKIGIRVKNLYKLEVDDCAALSTKAKLVQSQDIGELWHKWLGHLHHGALKIMQQISTGLPKGKLEQVDTCKSCTSRKYTKYSFHDRDSREKAILERVHINVSGPFSTCTWRERIQIIDSIRVLQDAETVLQEVENSLGKEA